MSDVRTVRLFKNGRNQAVRIPREFELPGDEALMFRDGSRLVIESKQRPSLAQLLASWEPLEESLPPIPDSPPEPVDL